MKEVKKKPYRLGSRSCFGGLLPVAFLAATYAYLHLVHIDIPAGFNECLIVNRNLTYSALVSIKLSLYLILMATVFEVMLAIYTSVASVLALGLANLLVLYPAFGEVQPALTAPFELELLCQSMSGAVGTITYFIILSVVSSICSAFLLLLWATARRKDEKG